MKKLSRRKFNATLALGVGAMLQPKQTFAAGANTEKKLGVALVGLGSYSEYQLAPALQETRHCKLTGIVTGTPAKEKIWAEKYDLPQQNIYNYDNFDAIADNEAIDIVYVVLPNAMHAEFCIRAAKAGKHVICEKPMAVSVEECDAIIAACEAAGVKLSEGDHQPGPRRNGQTRHDHRGGHLSVDPRGRQKDRPGPGGYGALLRVLENKVLYSYTCAR